MTTLGLFFVSSFILLTVGTVFMTRRLVGSGLSKIGARVAFSVVTAVGTGGIYVLMNRWFPAKVQVPFWGMTVVVFLLIVLFFYASYGRKHPFSQNRVDIFTKLNREDLGSRFLLRKDSRKDVLPLLVFVVVPLLLLTLIGVSLLFLR